MRKSECNIHVYIGWFSFHIAWHTEITCIHCSFLRWNNPFIKWYETRKGPRFYLCTQVPYVAVKNWNRSILTGSNIFFVNTTYQLSEQNTLNFCWRLLWWKIGIKGHVIRKSCLNDSDPAILFACSCVCWISKGHIGSLENDVVSWMYCFRKGVAIDSSRH